MAFSMARNSIALAQGVLYTSTGENRALAVLALRQRKFPAHSRRREVSFRTSLSIRRKTSIRPAPASDAHSAAGRPVRKTSGLAHGAMSGTLSTLGECARRASTNGAFLPPSRVSPVTQDDA